MERDSHRDSLSRGLPFPFYPAEGYHQQYLDKNPAGYCGIGGTGVSCPVGVAPADG
nr:peptide-methionine (S)-S-oxide reductase [Streptomyces daqingensis]